MTASAPAEDAPEFTETLAWADDERARRAAIEGAAAEMRLQGATWFRATMEPGRAMVLEGWRVRPVGEPVDNERRARRMDEIDRLPRETRMLVKEEGWTVVKAFLDCGVTKPARIRHLIQVVRDGAFDGGKNPLQRERVDAGVGR